jgi:mono/diheme cytochrome c family protein
VDQGTNTPTRTEQTPATTAGNSSEQDTTPSEVTPVDTAPSETETTDNEATPAGGASEQSAEAIPVANGLGYAELPDGRGGINVEAVVYPEAMGFDKSRSLEAFTDTVYAITLTRCSGCHSTANTGGQGAQAPLHADVDVQLAHEYALTRVNFREPEKSKLVERLRIDRHNCFGDSCQAAAQTMLDAVIAWRDAIADMIPEVPRGVEAGTQVTDEEVLAWIAEDKATVAAEDSEFIQYTSLHQLHNAGVSAQELNQARVAVSKALNSTARWAPEIKNPVDINGKGMVYRFDIRDYWGHTLIDTAGANFALYSGSSDDDLAFGSRVDVEGRAVSYNDLANMKTPLKPEVTPDEKFARLAWARVLRGNVEGAGDGQTHQPYIDGFIGTKSQGGNREQMVRPEDLQYVEASQLAFTLTRPDVYNVIMAIPGYSHYLEDELGVDKSNGMDSYDYMLTYEAITIDSRFGWRAETPTGYYWKTFDIFTQSKGDVDESYQNGDVYYPMWGHPVPKFVKNQGGTTAEDLSFVATLPLGSPSSGSGRVYTGAEGEQATAEEALWTLPNGLQGAALFGAFNQRRVDAFTLIVRDPRFFQDVDDRDLDNLTGYGREAGIDDLRLNTGSSCIGCHTDGMNRFNNNLRDWLDENPERLPQGQAGANLWLDDTATVERVRELYPPSSEMRGKIEDDRRHFLGAMAKIKEGMALGVDKNVYVEPTIWMVEWAREFYAYPQTRAN